ncbi:MAG TPA: DinB family protein [Clostridia bacterium]|nr:DinB family protein [Clostridia bacterium]
MKKTVRVFAVAILALAATAFAQDKKQAESKPTPPPPPASIAEVLKRQSMYVERNLASLAEAVPEEKFNFAPTQGEFNGVRTFQQQITHVAATNYVFAAWVLGEKSPVEFGEHENGPAVKNKTEAIKLLRDSFDYLRRAVDTVNADNALEVIKAGEGRASKLGLTMATISHVNDHYGQCVVYARMNGIVPPASRQQ